MGLSSLVSVFSTGYCSWYALVCFAVGVGWFCLLIVGFISLNG